MPDAEWRPRRNNCYLISLCLSIHSTTRSDSRQRGGEPPFSVQSAAVQNLFSGTDRITFSIPISVKAPTSYQISIQGHTAGVNRVLFAIVNKASVTLDPPPQILSVTPGTGNAGVTLQATITSLYTNFVQGATTANFGPDVTVTSVTVTSPSTAVAR